MIKNNIIIYIVSFNKNTMSYEILSTSEDEFLPPAQEIVLNTSITKNLFNLISKYIDIENTYDYNNISYTFLDIDITNEINIIYFISIPYNFPKKESYFIPIHKTSNELYIKNIQKILNRL